MPDSSSQTVQGLAKHQIYPAYLANGTLCIAEQVFNTNTAVSILLAYDIAARDDPLSVPLVLIFPESSFALARNYIACCKLGAERARRVDIPLYCRWYYWPPGQGSRAKLRVCFDYAGLEDL